MRRLLYCETSFWSRLWKPQESEAGRKSAEFLSQVRHRHDMLNSIVVVTELRKIRDQEKREALLDLVNAEAHDLLDFGARGDDLAEQIARMLRWSETRYADALHLAYTVLAKADVLVTWDVRDLARDRTRAALHAFARSKGFAAPVIGTPEDTATWLGLAIRRYRK